VPVPPNTLENTGGRSVVIPRSPVAPNLKAQRRDLQAQLRAVVADSFRVCARLHAAGELNEETERELKRIQKWPARLELESLEGIRHKLDVARAFQHAVRAAARPELLAEHRPTPGEVVPFPGEKREGRRARSALPISLNDLPPASFLDDLLTDKISWTSALAMPKRSKELGNL
jgi:hypothetical protein